MKKILIFIDWFTPGYRAGGPIKSISNFANLLNTDFEIFVYTADTDFGTTEPYKGIAYSTWVNVDTNIWVYYAPQKTQTATTIREVIKEVEPQFIYLNSMFSWHFSIQVLLQKKYFPNIKFVLAPRGMLKASALRFKALKKRTFISAAKLMGLYDKVFFHATDATEANDIKSTLLKDASLIEEVGNCPAKPDIEFTFMYKNVNELKALFIGRVHRIKNLDYLLKLLKNVKGNIELNIVGTIEDKVYYEECKTLIKTLPSNIEAKILGEMAPFELENFIKLHHILILPTQGENFGHAIYECLALARPVIISDQTPWNNVSQYDAGWAIPLSEPLQFAEKIDYMASLNQMGYNIHCYGAIELANKFYENPEIKAKYFKLFSN